VFVHPWEVHNAFHAFHDNVLAVLAEVIVDYLHYGGSTLDTHKYTLYQYKYYNNVKWDYYAFGANKNHSRIFELLPIIFGSENILPVGALLKGGPHCVKHLTWGTARKTFQLDALVDIRRASYDVLHHILHSYTTSQHSNALAALYTSKTLPNPTHRPRVLIITRAGLSRYGNGRLINKRSEMALIRQYENEGFRAELCCDFAQINTVDKLIRQFQDVDVCVGIHGAGLTNCVLGKRGITIVEFQVNYAYGTTYFHKLAHMASGHHVFYDIRGAQYNRGYTLTADMSSDIVDVSKRLYIHSQRTAVAELMRTATVRDISSTDSCTALYNTGGYRSSRYDRSKCMFSMYTSPPTLFKTVVIDYKQDISYTKSSNTGQYIQAILGYNNNISDVALWKMQSTREGQAFDWSSHMEYLKTIIKRNERAYFIQLSPASKPYSRVSTTLFAITSVYFCSYQRINFGAGIDIGAN